MIDLHAHVLPGFDDGPAALEESLAMLRQAAAQGLTAVTACPHIMKGSYDHTRESIAAAVAELNAAAQAEQIPVTVYPGGENYLDFDLVEAAKAGTAATLGAGKYLLLEFPALGLPQGMDSIIFDLQISGYHPVLAHPERNVDIINQPSLLYEMVYKGVLVQQNAGSLLGYFGGAVQKVAKLFLQHNLVHVVASDAHDSRQRDFKQQAWVTAATPLIGADNVAQLTRAVPAAILRGAEVEFNDPRPITAGGWAQQLRDWLTRKR